MLTKNLTPFLFGAKASSRKPQQNEMTLVVRGSYRIDPATGTLSVIEGTDQGSLTADVYADGDDEQRGECVYASDFADFKLNAEVIVRAHCHTPGKKPLLDCPVHVSVGAWSKSLRVVGRRTWREGVGSSPSEPAPFTEMPIAWANAFGGAGFDENPAGKGMDGGELPTIEDARTILRSREDRPRPGGFGPISKNWPARTKKMGTRYGAEWRKTRAPHFAEDFDWRFMSAAPEDQQIDGYLRGDEEVTFQNLHGDKAVLSLKLPGRRIRAFVRSTDARFREVGMVLDTLYVDLEKNELVLTWRGVDAVAEDDLADVKTVLVASEALGEALPIDWYAGVIEAYEKDPVGLGALMPSLPGAPEEPVNDADPVARALAARGVPKQHQAAFANAFADAKKVKPDLDIEAELAKVDADTATPFAPIKPGVLPPLGLRKQMRELLEKVRGARTQALEAGIEPEKLRELDRAEQTPSDPRLAQLDPSYSYPHPLSTDEPGPGADLRDRDLSGRDLRGANLEGANLESANLTKTNLEGANLRGASLRFSTLYKTNLAGADLTDADLTLVNAKRANLVGASLAKAKLETACFEEALLDEALLDDATGEYVIFVKARMSKIKAARARLSRSDFDGANLTGASLTGATIEKALFARVDLSDANLGAAKLSGSSFHQSKALGASFEGATLVLALVTNALWEGAKLGRAVLTSAHFTECDATGATFARAIMRKTRFYRAILDRADFTEADLMGADLRKARVTKTNFANASLYDAKLLGAAGEGTNFEGANLQRAMVSE